MIRNKEIKYAGFKINHFSSLGRLHYNYTISPSPFLPLNPPIYPSLLSFEYMASVFINCCGITAETKKVKASTSKDGGVVERNSRTKCKKETGKTGPN